MWPMLFPWHIIIEEYWDRVHGQKIIEVSVYRWSRYAQDLK